VGTRGECPQNGGGVGKPGAQWRRVGGRGVVQRARRLGELLLVERGVREEESKHRGGETWQQGGGCKKFTSEQKKGQYYAQDGNDPPSKTIVHCIRVSNSQAGGKVPEKDGTTAWFIFLKGGDKLPEYQNRPGTNRKGGRLRAKIKHAATTAAKG